MQPNRKHAFHELKLKSPSGHVWASCGLARIVTTLKWQFLSSCQTQEQEQFNASDSRLRSSDDDDVGLLLLPAPS